MNLTGVLKKDQGVVQDAQAEVSKLCASWETPDWDELDWAKIKDLQLRDILDQRKHAADRAQHRECLSCPEFLDHVSPDCMESLHC
jgi:antiviral helicase SKI2